MPFTRLQTIRASGFFSNLDTDRDGNVLALAYGGDLLVRYAEDGAVSTILSAQYNYFNSGTVKLLSDGRYLLVTGSDFPFGNTRGVDFQIVNRDGTPATAIKSLYPPEVSIYEQSQGYTVTTTADGGFTIVFTDVTHSNDQFTVTFPQTSDFPRTSDPRSAGQDVYSQHFDATGTATGAWVVSSDAVETVENGTANRRVLDQSVFDSTTLTGGQVAYVYFDQRHEGSNGIYGGAENFTQLSLVIEGNGSNVRGVRVDDNPLHQGGPNGDLQNNNEINGASGGNVVALANGTLAVVWQENSYVYDLGVYGHYRFDGTDTYIRYFDASGNALSDPTIVLHRSTALGNIQRYVFAEALPDGRVVIAYNDGIDGRNGNGETEAYLGIVGNLGATVEHQRISPDAANGQSFGVRDLVVRSDGSVDVAIERGGTFPAGSDPNGIYIHHYTFGYGFNGTAVAGTDAGDTLVGGTRNDQMAGYRGDDAMSGGGGNDTIYGNEGADRLRGNVGADKLFGNEGDDVLEGGAGADDLRGGDGLDSASYTASTSAVNINLATGAKSGDTTGDRYTSIEGLIGTAFVDRLTGDAGANRLEGLGGNDVLLGGGGNDTYVVETTGDRIVEEADAGNDTVFAAFNYTLGATLENLTLTGTATNGTGNAAANVVTGNARDNVLKGLDGNDVLTGGDGADTLYGGSGDDQMFGGDGNDKLYLEGGFDLMVGGAGDDEYTLLAGSNPNVSEAVGGGIDTVFSAISFYAYSGSEIENIILTGTASVVYGNDFANQITGNASGNFLVGYGGADVIRGEGGDDNLVGGDGADLLGGGRGKDALNGGTGADVFQFFDGDTDALATNADTIQDFKRADGDRINLLKMDAIASTPANDRFDFIGTGAFHGVAGELRYVQDASNTYISGDTNGDGAADFTIALTGVITLGAADFVL